MPILALLFLVTAACYGAAGFGGGSTYTALLAGWGDDLLAVPVLSLSCNIVVVTIGWWRFGRAGHVQLSRIWPLAAASVPMAFVGGALPVPRLLFTGLLAASLLVAALFMIWRPRAEAEEPRHPGSRWTEPALGGTLGLLAGIVGIGGGIYLAPALHLMRWGTAHAIAGASSVFILVNSLAGLAGQFAKSGPAAMATVADHWPLLVAVAAGGAAGALLSTTRLPAYPLRLLTAVLILFVAGQLVVRLAAGIAAG